LPEENRATEVETAHKRQGPGGDKPAETPQELIVELGRVSTELLDLIKRINRTNSARAFARGTISDALAERDVLALQRAAYAELGQTAAIRMVASRVRK
jgi:hypothetical protein